MDPRQERAARNEALFREANAGIDRRRRELGVEEPTPYICECARERCTEVFLIAPAEYLDVRRHPTRFVQVAGHADENERVVAARDGYVVVEKLGDGARVAREEA